MPTPVVAQLVAYEATVGHVAGETGVWIAHGQQMTVDHHIEVFVVIEPDAGFGAVLEQQAVLGGGRIFLHEYRCPEDRPARRVEVEHVHQFALIKKREPVETEEQVLGAGGGVELPDLIIQRPVPLFRSEGYCGKIARANVGRAVGEGEQIELLAGPLNSAVVAVIFLVDVELPGKNAKAAILRILNTHRFERGKTVLKRMRRFERRHQGLDHFARGRETILG